MDIGRLIDAFFNPTVFGRYVPDILRGIVTTLEISVAIVVTGLLLGLALAMLRTYRIALVNAVLVVFVDVMRALPPLVTILIL